MSAKLTPSEFRDTCSRETPSGKVGAKRNLNWLFKSFVQSCCTWDSISTESIRAGVKDTMATLDPRLISTHCGTCIEAFSLFINALEYAEPKFKEQVSSLEIQTQLGRFRVWAGNLAVHQTGKSSLDYKLRYVEHMRQRAVSLLDDLDDTLRNGP